MMMDTTTPTAPRERRTNQPPTPPRMTKAEWLRRPHSSVTLSRSDLEQIAQLLAAGRVLLRDQRPVPAKLRATMTRLGISTTGL